MMKNYLSNLESRISRVIRVIGKEADRKRLSAYVVGGVVRDIILKKKNLDLDIVVEGDAIGLAKTLARRWKGKLTVYKQFGTACLEGPGGLCIDFAMARKEHYAYSGALPIVRPGSLREDLFRRDFAINAMAIAINPGCFGHLIDECGGLTDLSQRKIKILYDRSFMDDPTRILRAVRFEQRLRFRMARQTFLLMKKALGNNILTNIKPPRYFAEFKKILYEEDPLRGLKRLYDLGAFQVFPSGLKVRFKNLSLMHRRIQGMRRKSLYEQNRPWWLIYFMGLIAEADDRVVKDILSKFHFTKDERISIQQSQKTGDMIRELSVRNLRSSRVFQILRPLAMEVVLYLRVKTSQAVVCRRIDRFLSKDIHVRLRIDGEDLKRMGIVSGYRIGNILENVLCLKIDKHVGTKREELKAAWLYSQG